MSRDKGELLKRAVQVAVMKAQEFPIGTQIMYMPDYANMFDLSCEYGFIFSYPESNNVFCRFFNDRSSDSTKGWENLRTVANSEACRPKDLYIYNSRPQKIVDACVKKIQKDFDKGRTGR